MPGHYGKKSGNTTLTGRNKNLAKKYGDPNKITRGDIITAVKNKKRGKA